MRQIILLTSIGVGLLLNTSNFTVEFCNISTDYHLLLPLLSGIVFLVLDKKWLLKNKFFYGAYFTIVIGVLVFFEIARLRIISPSFNVLTFMSILTLIISLSVAASFWLNSPFYIDSYKTDSKVIAFIYKTISVFYILLTVYHAFDYFTLTFFFFY